MLHNPAKRVVVAYFINYFKVYIVFCVFKIFLEVIKDIEQTGNLGPIAGAIANVQVIEIFKYLIGKGDLNLNKFAEIDFMNFNIEWRDFTKTIPSKI